MIIQKPLFSNFSDNDIRTIHNFGCTRQFPRRVRVFTEGDEGNSVYFINNGQVKVYTNDDEGNQSTIRYQGPGEYFGELALIDEQPRSATVETTADSDFTIVSKLDFRDCLSEYPSLATKLIPALTSRIRDLTEELTQCKLFKAYRRLRPKLYQLAAEKNNGTLLIEQRFTQEELGHLIGTSRETITNILNQLKIGGWIEVNPKKQIVIKKTLPRDF